jgi:Xaa-Pro aminopeptidase
MKNWLSWNLPRFSKDEGDRRHQAVRAEMELRGIDCLIVPGHLGNYGSKAANFQYLSNYRMWFDDEYIVFFRDSEGTIFTRSEAHANWANRISWIPAVCEGGKNHYVKAIVDLLKEKGYDKSTIGVVDMEILPASVYLGIVGALPKATIIEAKDVILRQRMIKSPLEIEFMRRAGECADRGFEAMRDTAKVGVEDSEVWTACETALTRSGAEPPSFTLYVSGPWKGRGIGFPYGPNPRTLERGDLVLNEITPCYGGYFVQLCRPISLGKPDEAFLHAYEVSLEIYHLALEYLKPGYLLKDVEGKIIALAKAKGYRSSPNAGIQNIGLDITERIPKGAPLRSGMTTVVHAWIDHPISNPTVGGHTIGDTVVIGDSGAESLSTLPLELTVL